MNKKERDPAKVISLAIFMMALYFQFSIKNTELAIVSLGIGLFLLFTDKFTAVKK